MALNVIRVETLDGTPVFLGVPSIVSITRTPDGAAIALANGDTLQVRDEAKLVADRMNYRGPDGF